MTADGAQRRMASPGTLQPPRLASILNRDFGILPQQAAGALDGLPHHLAWEPVGQWAEEFSGLVDALVATAMAANARKALEASSEVAQTRKQALFPFPHRNWRRDPETRPYV